MVLNLHSVSYLHVGPKAAGGAGLTTVTRCRGTEEMVAVSREVVALIIWTKCVWNSGLGFCFVLKPLKCFLFFFSPPNNKNAKTAWHLDS